MIVDDDVEIRTLLSRYLQAQGFRVREAAGKRECEAILAMHTPDLVVLDVMLPDGSGLDVCRALAHTEPPVAVILLTALKEDVDRIVGLELGADDYIGKPFNPRELVARIRAVLRRHTGERSPETQFQIFAFGAFEVDPQLRRVLRDNEEVVLTGAEFALLMVFLERPGRLLSREQLLEFTQSGRERSPFDRSIDVLMSRLRRKLGDTDAGPVFKTVRNGGYQMTLPVRAVLVGR
ncbi:two-component system, OmpR family, response regulator [Xaviernesmea oryzae]|nr:two-component system, OmpR family, response regulator [Xaviernesmea oryzae]